MTEHAKKYVQMTAAFAVARESAPRFDLLVGIHPEEQRWLQEDEEQLPMVMLRFMRRKDLLGTRHPDRFEKLALLWFRLFPEIDGLLSLDHSAFYEALWKLTLETAEPLDVAYAFHPVEFNSNDGEQSRREEIRSAAHRIQRQIEQRAAADPRARGKITWAFPFPADGPLGKIVEQRAGLSAELKRGLGLTHYSAGLLCNFLLHRGVSIDQLLNPYQLEDLTASIFREEGWEATKTPKTRDGGKDVIARRIINGRPTVAYVEAKMYSRSRKVGISEVKEFVATVAGDNADRGFIVTTSYFSKPAVNWLQKKGISLAVVELVDRTVLETKMRRIADSEIAAYLVRR